MPPKKTQPLVDVGANKKEELAIKQRAAAKGTKPGAAPFKDFTWPRRLGDDFRDLCSILIGLGLFYLLGKSLAEKAGAHGEEVHHEAEVHHRARALNGHADPMLDMQVTLGICVFLITVTIGFEIFKHKLEHGVPPIMASVMNAMFGELTVLGFIALVAYMMLRFGAIEYFSELIYHDPEHLIHLFEDIHFMLFFVMLTFLAQACVFVLATLKAESKWLAFEAFMGKVGYPKPGEARSCVTAVAGKFDATLRAGKRAKLCRCIPVSILWWYREAEAREELTYALFRDRFIEVPIKPGKPPLPPDFDFSTYLRLRCIHEVTHVLHVGEDTWILVILFLGACLYLPVVEHEYTEFEVTVYYVIGLCWAIWLLACLMRSKLSHAERMLTPAHEMLTGKRRPRHDEEAPTAALLQKPELPPFEQLKPSKTANKHERLFWRGRKGPGHLLKLMRLQMLVAAICLAIVYSWLNANPHDYLLLLGALFPVLHVMIFFPKIILPLMVVTTSVESLKKQGDVNATLTEMKTEKTLKLLKLLSTLQAQAKRVAKLQAGSSPVKRKAKPAKADPAKEAELRVAFDLFDADKSGFIDSAELGAVMLSLGVALDEGELSNLMVQMDASGDGQINFSEFAEVMGGSDEPEPVEKVAHSIFKLVDKDGSGKITHAELRASLLSLGGGLTEEDIMAALDLFDTGNDGVITQHEFVQVLQLMKTFE